MFYVMDKFFPEFLVCSSHFLDSRDTARDKSLLGIHIVLVDFSFCVFFSFSDKVSLCEPKSPCICVCVYVYVHVYVCVFWCVCGLVGWLVNLRRDHTMKP